jgi:hypothetical protein
LGMPRSFLWIWQLSNIYIHANLLLPMWHSAQRTRRRSLVVLVVLVVLSLQPTSDRASAPRWLAHTHSLSLSLSPSLSLSLSRVAH